VKDVTALDRAEFDMDVVISGVERECACRDEQKQQEAMAQAGSPRVP
jgi:hypothetical protein